jgi:hypothetical protein
MLLRRLFRSSLLGLAAAYFMNPTRGAARRARAQRLLRSLKTRVVNQINARRALPAQYPSPQEPDLRGAEVVAVDR